MTPQETVRLCEDRARALGIDLPEWARVLILEHPENATFVCDAVAVQAGLIPPPIPESYSEEAFLAEGDQD